MLLFNSNLILITEDYDQRQSGHDHLEGFSQIVHLRPHYPMSFSKTVGCVALGIFGCHF